MRRRARWLLAVLGLASSSDARAEPEAERARRLVVLGAGTLAWIAHDTFVQDALAPDDCRWCASNALDRGARDALRWDDRRRAELLSDVTTYGVTPLVVLGAIAIDAASSSRATTRLVDDAIPIVEAVVYGQVITATIKSLAGRQRPYARFSPMDDPSSEDNLSFVSGHTSLPVSLTVAAGVVAHRRRAAGEPVIWAAGLTLGATAGYLRIAADRHYLTDVAGGAAVGVLAGVFIPRLTGSFPACASIVPIANGAALAGRF